MDIIKLGPLWILLNLDHYGYYYTWTTMDIIKLGPLWILLYICFKGFDRLIEPQN